MGRDISFVVVPRSPEHETNKQCFNLNEELTGDDSDCFMCCHFPESRSAWSAKSENHDTLCSVCAWFMQPVIDKDNEPMILDELSFSYNYTRDSPVHSSYSIFNSLPVYEVDSSYAQTTHSRVYEVTKENIITLESNINHIQSDKLELDLDAEALYDSNNVLSFLKSWSPKEDVKLLCFR
jgi:hypothetical protein